MRRVLARTGKIGVEMTEFLIGLLIGIAICSFMEKYETPKDDE